MLYTGRLQVDGAALSPVLGQQDAAGPDRDPGMSVPCATAELFVPLCPTHDQFTYSTVTTVTSRPLSQ